MRAVPVTPRQVMFTVCGQCPSLHAEGLKIKFTLVLALRFCTGRTIYRGSRGIALDAIITITLFWLHVSAVTGHINIVIS